MLFAALPAALRAWLPWRGACQPGRQRAYHLLQIRRLLARRPVAYDVQNAFAAHVEATAKALEWAEKCLALRRAGKAAQAKKAEIEVKRWLKRTMLIEAATARAKPHGGRMP
jgi:hypothetical protein